MEQETPISNNRKTIALLGALVVITVAGAIIPASWFKVDRPNQTLDLTSVDTINVTPKNKDTDQPLTWKQLAEQTFSDQPEILEELKSTPIDNNAISQLNDEENLTASFSKSLYLASAYLKENGVTDEESKQDVVNQLIEQEASKIIPTVYTYKDISVAKAESKDSIKAYGNSVAFILSNIITEASLNADIKALHDYTKTQDPATIAPITKDYTKVSDIVQKLLKIPVPASATVYHLSSLNQITAYRDMLGNMSKMATDPMRANIALKNYTDTVISTISVYKNLSDYFDTKNIVFNSKESGYVFTVGYTPK